MVDAEFGEILVTCERIRWTIENGEKALAPEYQDPSPILPHKIAKVVYQPLGVVAALVSWNYPQVYSLKICVYIYFIYY